MLSLTLSILFWCMPDKQTLGIVALVLSIFGFIIDMLSWGWLSVIDLVLVVVDAIVLYKHRNIF